jgi:hypothetical protein
MASGLCSTYLFFRTSTSLKMLANAPKDRQTQEEEENGFPNFKLAERAN